MVCIYHNRDLDGFTSGAVVKRKFPDCKLVGWDYGMAIPWDQIPENEPVIMIDISFPMDDMAKVRQKCGDLTWIDHHISAFKDWTDLSAKNPYLIAIKYIYVPGIAACEIGWEHFFPDEKMPEAVLLLGEYDTWRKDNEVRWENEILPFQYYMRLVCKGPETFPDVLFGTGRFAKEAVAIGIDKGDLLLSYQRNQDERAMKGSFVCEFEGQRALCCNIGGASSNSFLSVWDESKHDVMIPFFYSGSKWSFSMYTTKEEVDCSVIAKKLGGGGHKKAAGFILQELPATFKKQKDGLVSSSVSNS